jgi:hypothetical protein
VLGVGDSAVARDQQGHRQLVEAETLRHFVPVLRQNSRRVEFSAR